MRLSFAFGGRAHAFVCACVCVCACNAQEGDAFRVNPGVQHQGTPGRRLLNDLSAGAWEPGLLSHQRAGRTSQRRGQRERERRGEGRDPGDPPCCGVTGGGTVLVTVAF